MHIDEVKTYDDLVRYLREFTQFRGDPVPYDFNGAFHLFLAILDNLARHHMDADLADLQDEEFGPWFIAEQRAFLKKLERLS